MSDQNSHQLASDLRTVITRMIKKLRKNSPTGQGLSLTERSTIALLDQHGELLPNELASMEKITTQSMSQILNHLMELGYINRTMSATDKRKAIISLTEAGRQVLYTVRHERDEWLDNAITAVCTAEEQAALQQALGALTKLVDYE